LELPELRNGRRKTKQDLYDCGRNYNALVRMQGGL